MGESASFTFLRDRDGKLEKMSASAVLGERPDPPQLGELDDVTIQKVNPKESEAKSGLHLGLTLGELTQQLITDKHLTGVRGLYVKEVDPSGLAAELRAPNGQQALIEGDVITRINRVPVTTLADFQRVVTGLKTGDPIVLQVSRFVGDRVQTRIVQFTYQ
ncbi:MAG TPA: PDZ domain-containing protein [Pyrinomonadaceae bacterium]|nr:PDZ domain-containing protein [Pyrinomonadaceae bacterium]